MNKNREILIKQKILNTRLAKFLKENKIKNLRMISMGNSIASGYSVVRVTIPLLLRNESLFNIMQKNGINVDLHHFARAQNNYDEHIFEWIENNIKESIIHKMNRSDYESDIVGMGTHGLSKQKIEEYYPTEIENDNGLQKVITESNDNLANVIIYNGATGSLIDGLTRHGTIFQQFLHGVKRDINSIESILKVIQTYNREKNSNTQVYLCGVPNFLGLNLSELINAKLKKIASKYANVTYVEPVKSKLFYQKMNKKNNFLEFKGIDVHYDEDEYIEFNNNIIKSIVDNYQILQSLINVDRLFYKLNRQIELEKKLFNIRS